MTFQPKLDRALADRYAIEREIGKGGMATVYLARDLRHQRLVALKVLDPELGALLGVDRFLSEIRVTANLQHPNLLPLFDSGEAASLLYYVMPFVEGESLRHRLDRERQLPVDEAIEISSSIAAALDYAHRRGVIHRDLKPENILLHEGQALLADFGIALAVSNAAGSRVTQTGLSLGTPHYMSPEQATGDRIIDARTDIYSLGAVLYEMLTGEPPHVGASSQAIIARVLTEEPRRVSASRPNAPRHVEVAVSRALAKLPADRYGTAGAFAEALTTPSFEPGPATATVAANPVVSRTRQTAERVALITALGVVSLVAAWGWLRPRERAAPTVQSRFTITVPDSQSLRVDLEGANLAISNDGAHLVYMGGLPTPRLYARHMNDLDARAISGTEGAATPRFSPDGRWLAFTAGDQLRKVPYPAGGQVTTITTGVNRYSWGDGDVVVVAQSRAPLRRVSAAGGPLTAITQLDTARDEIMHSWPEVLPGGEAVLFTIHTDSTAGFPPELAVVRLRDRVVKRLEVRGTNPRYVSSGHILFGNVDEGALSAAPFDMRKLEITGPVVSVLEGILVKAGGATEIAVSRSGTLVYVEVTGSELVQVDRGGSFSTLVRGPGRYQSPRMSPRGDRIALGIRSASGESDVWMYELASRTMSRLTRDGRNSSPAFTGDGRRVVWLSTGSYVESSEGGKILSQRWDGSGAPDTIWSIEGGARGFDIPRNADFLVTLGRSGTWRATLADTGDRRELPSVGGGPLIEISPDGRWRAFQAGQARVRDVYVMPLDSGGRHQISVDGGSEPAWSTDGRTLFYRTISHVIAATLRTEPEFTVVRRDTLFRDVFIKGVSRTHYDVLSNGDLLMVRRAPDQQRAVVVTGWVDELKERMRQAQVP